MTSQDAIVEWSLPGPLREIYNSDAWQENQDIRMTLCDRKDLRRHISRREARRLLSIMRKLEG